jgi:hypothetical protein
MLIAYLVIKENVLGFEIPVDKRRGKNENVMPIMINVMQCVPINNIKRVQVAKSACHFSSVKTRPVLREAPLFLQVEEQLEEISSAMTQERGVEGLTYLSAVHVVENEVELVGGLE